MKVEMFIGDEGQLELYNIKDEEIKQIVDDMVEHATDINLNQLVMYELKDYLNVLISLNKI